MALHESLTVAGARTDMRLTSPDHVTAGSASFEAHQARSASPALRLIEHRSPTSPPTASPGPSMVPGRRERFASWSRRYVLGLAIADIAVGAAAVGVPAMISHSLSTGNLASYAMPLTMLGAVLWPLAILLLRGYDRSAIGVGSDELRAVLRAGVVIVVIGAFPAGWLQKQTLITLLVVATPFAVALSTLARLVARRVLHKRQRAGRNFRRVLVAGSTPAVRELSRRIAKEPVGGMRVVGACLPRQEISDADDLTMPVVGTLESVAQAANNLEVDAVAVTSDDATRDNYLRRVAWSLEGSGVELLVDPGLVEVAGPRMHIRPMIGFPLLHVEEPHFTGWRRALKRGSDILLTGLGVIAISPLLILIALAVKFQDGGPIFFKQSRVGRGGVPFTMYKFRSMVVDAEARKAELMDRNEGKGGLFKLSDDPRITRLGKFLRDYSLDELPQLFNVLNGTMSLVGPRPHLAHEIAAMPSEASRRALVTPGLTGLWQVSGRSDLEGDDAVRLDLRYVENWSLTLDLLILWKTGYAVLAKRGSR